MADKLRRVLGGMLLLFSIVFAGNVSAAIPMDVMILLYRKEAPEAPPRTDPIIQAASRSLEKELISLKYRIPQTPPDVLKALDRSPYVIVSFAPDAGLSMVYSVYRNMRPDPALNTGAAEVSISARVFVGSSLLSVEEGRAVIRARIDKGMREFSERRAFEVAAQRAAASLVEAVDARLKALTPEDMAAYEEISNVSETVITEVEPPPQASPSQAGPSLVGAPPASAPPTQIAVSPTETSPQPEIVLPDAPPSSVPPIATAPTPAPTPSTSGSLDRAARQYAVVIGVSDYSNVARINNSSTKSLPGVPTDVRHMAGTFRQLGVAEDDIKVLLDKDATIANVKSTLDQIAHRAGADDLVAVYISGHGAPANFKRLGMAMPILYDMVFAQADSAPDFQELMEEVTRSTPARVVLMLDTCHSGGASSVLTNVVFSQRGIALSKAHGGPEARLVARSAPMDRDIAVLAAARFDEVSIDQGPQRGGLFTQYLAKGLVDGRGTETLRQIIEQRVARPVIDASIESCRAFASRGSPCPTGQQTPTMGFSGKGDRIRM